LFTSLDIVGAVRAAIVGVELGRTAECRFMLLDGLHDMIFIGGIAIQDPVLSDQTATGLGQVDLVTELDGFSGFTAFDQRGVGFKDRVDFLGGRNWLIVDDAGRA
jgi:hypothetical protein